MHMVLLETADTAAGCAAVITNSLPKDLSTKATLLYEALRSIADKVSDNRGYCAAVSVVHFFVPGEVVANALCMARSTLYLKLAELKEAELVEARAHYVSYKGRTRADGMVWAIKMHPERPGAIRVPYDALKKSYRCLSADIANGRTAFREIGQSKENPIKQVNIQKILAWALPPLTTQKSGTGLTVRCDLEQVLDLPHVDKADRRTAVDGAARTLSSVLNDSGGLMFWRWLCWRLISLEASGIPATHQVYEQVRRVLAEQREGYGRVPAALLVSRLRAYSWWEQAKHGPTVRVGTRPN
jgi:hypothetical protein